MYRSSPYDRANLIADFDSPAFSVRLPIGNVSAASTSG